MDRQGKTVVYVVPTQPLQIIAPVRKMSAGLGNFVAKLWANFVVGKRLAYVRIAIACCLAGGAIQQWRLGKWEVFYGHADQMAHAFANPSLMYKARTHDGREVMVDDYLQSYYWLKANTPPSSRVMAWWDYGYQITGIGNRTSIADGNTWNHEHIGLLGMCLVSPVEKAHSLIRHLADYVLVWAGGGGDDLAKSIHMARISNSVFLDICPGDAQCSFFGFNGNKPTPSMEKSLLYVLTTSGLQGATVDKKYFTLAHQTAYGKVRIFKVSNVSKESKAWVQDPENRLCDYEDAWDCKGQYPPAPELQKALKKRRAFKQFEDFNKKTDAKESFKDRYFSKSELSGMVSAELKKILVGRNVPVPEVKDKLELVPKILETNPKKK